MKTRTAALTTLLGLTLAACGQSPDWPGANQAGLDAQALSVQAGTYEIISRLSGKALDVQDWSGQDGAAVQQWSPTHNANQQWRLTQQADGSYQVAAVHSGKVLDIYGVSPADGAAVVQWTWNGGDNQRWQISESSDGYVKLSAKHSGKVLDVSGMGTNDGALVQQWTDVGNLNQQWKLVRVGAPATVTPSGAPPVLDQSGQPITVPGTTDALPGGACHVSPGGNDETGDGSAGKPWKSFEQALRAAPPGAIIVFHAGTYRVSGRQSVDHPLTLRAAPGEQVWLKGSAVVTGWVQDGNAWRRDGWTYSFPNQMGNENFADPNDPTPGYRDQAYVNGRALRQVLSRGAVGPGKFYVDAANQRLYLGDDPSGQTVEATVADGALGLWLGGTNAAGLTVRGLGFAHFADPAIRAAVSKVTLDQNAFVWNGTEGVTFHGESGDIGAGSRDGVSLDEVVTGNLFAYNGNNGFGASKAHRMRVEGNTFRGNNTEAFSTAWGASGMKFIGTDDALIKNNLFEDNHGMGLWLDVGDKNTKMIGNTVRRNDAAGLFVEISSGTLVAGNVFEDNGKQGVSIGNSANNRVYNNTFVNNGKALRIDEQQRGSFVGVTEEYPGGAILQPNWVTKGNVVKNNLFVNAVGTGDPTDVDALIDTWWFYDAGGHSGDAPMLDALDFNVYARTTAGQPQLLARWVRPGKADQDTFKTLAELAQSTSFEPHGRERNGAALTDLFVNPGAGDYRLNAGSGLTGAGEALPQDVADALGVASGRPVDPGAPGH